MPRCPPIPILRKNPPRSVEAKAEADTIISLATGRWRGHDRIGPTPAPTNPTSLRERFPSTMTRSAHIRRETAETRIELSLDLDGSGKASIATGVGFFDHMLTLLAKHSLIDLTVQAVGDLHVDAHHTVEDVGICYGQALAQALGDKAGIRRY